MRSYERRMRTTLWGRIGSPVRVDEEAATADAAGVVLAEDAVYNAIKNHRPLTGNWLRDELDGAGTEVLAGPAFAVRDPAKATGDRTSFDDVRVSESEGRAYGIFGTTADIASGRGSFRLAGMNQTQAAVKEQAVALAQHEITRGRDTFNGTFPRLLDSRVESAAETVRASVCDAVATG